MQLSLSAVGLIADIIGVGFIGYAFLRTDARTLYRQASTTWDYNATALAALCEQKVDNLFGFAFLLAGFFLQLLSAIHIEPSWKLDSAAFGLVLVTAIITAIVFRRRVVRYYEKKAVAAARPDQ